LKSIISYENLAKLIPHTILSGKKEEERAVFFWCSRVGEMDGEKKLKRRGGTSARSPVTACMHAQAAAASCGGPTDAC